MAEEMFLKIDGIQGESTDASRKDEINILSYTWGESLPAATARGSGTGAARVIMQDFHFVMRVNKASPKLFLACANGARIKKVVQKLRTQDKSRILKKEQAAHVKGISVLLSTKGADAPTVLVLSLTSTSASTVKKSVQQFDSFSQKKSKTTI